MRTGPKPVRRSSARSAPNALARPTASWHSDDSSGRTSWPPTSSACPGRTMLASGPGSPTSGPASSVATAATRASRERARTPRTTGAPSPAPAWLRQISTSATTPRSPAAGPSSAASPVTASAYAGFETLSTDAWACPGVAFTPDNAGCPDDLVRHGAFVKDVTRGTDPPIASGAGLSYTLEILQGVALQAELLSRAGHPDAWNRLRPAFDWARRNGVLDLSSVGYHVTWWANERLGWNVTTRPAAMGRIFGFTDWLYGSPAAGSVPVPPPTPSRRPPQSDRPPPRLPSAPPARPSHRHRHRPRPVAAGRPLRHRSRRPFRPAPRSTSSSAGRDARGHVSSVRMPHRSRHGHELPIDVPSGVARRRPARRGDHVRGQPADHRHRADGSSSGSPQRLRHRARDVHPRRRCHRAGELHVGLQSAPNLRPARSSRSVAGSSTVRRLGRPDHAKASRSSDRHRRPTRAGASCSPFSDRHEPRRSRLRRG